MIFKSFFAGYLAVVIYSLGLTLSSHLISRKRYVARWDSSIARQALRFGLPLLFDCILIGFIINADRFLVAISGTISSENPFSLPEVSVYCLAFGLCYAFALLLVRAGTTVFHPWLLKAASDEALFRRRVLDVADIAVVLAVVIVLTFGVCGRLIFEWVYGPRYVLPPGLLESMSLAYAIRLYRMITEVAAFAQGRNTEVLYINFVRFIGICVIPIVISAGFGLVGVAWACLIAEGLACAFAFSRFLRIFVPRTIGSVLQKASFGTLIAGGALILPAEFPAYSSATMLFAVSAVLGCITVWVLPASRSGMRVLFEKQLVPLVSSFHKRIFQR